MTDESPDRDDADESAPPARRGSDSSGGDDSATVDRFDDDPSPPDAVRREDRGTVVPKAKFCEQCDHFADPPQVACNHEGTTILELVDRDCFRVVDCPVVAERERLREGGTVPDASDDG